MVKTGKEAAAVAAAKPTQPDAEAFKTECERFEKAITALDGDRQKVQTEIEAKNQGKTEYQQKKTEMGEKLDEYEKIIVEQMGKRQTLISILKSNKEAERASKREDGASRDQLVTLEAVDRKMNEIEHRMHTTSMSLKDEKKLMEELKALKAKKPDIKKAMAIKARKAEEIAASQEGPSVDMQLDALKLQIEECKAAKKAQSDQLRKLVDQRKAATAELQPLFDKKDKIWEQKQEQVRARNTFRDAFHAQKREWEAHLAEVRQAKNEKMRVVNLQRQAERQQWNAEKALEEEEEMPHIAQTTLLEQTIQYCEKLVHTDVVEEEEVKETKHNNPEGSMVLGSKKDRGNQMLICGSKSKKVQRQRVKKQAPLKHTVHSLEVFANLGLDAPKDVSDVEGVLTALREKLAGYKTKQADWTADQAARKAKAQEKAAEAQAKAAALKAEAELVMARNAEAAAQREEVRAEAVEAA